MIPRLISSLQHPIVKRLVKLRESRSFRAEEERVVIVGDNVVRDVAAHTPLKTLLSTAPTTLEAETSWIVTPAIVEKIAGISTQETVVAEVAIPAPVSLDNAATIVILDGLSDPGNVGTILRTALALGIEGALLTPTTADPFNDKALRASRAAPLFLPYRFGTFEELGEPHHLYIADVEGEELSTVDFKRPLALVLGHETRGPSSHLKSMGRRIKIPMHPAMESLNVASAAAIILYQIQLK